MGENFGSGVIFGGEQISRITCSLHPSDTNELARGKPDNRRKNESGLPGSLNNP
jgi:hypothetical protein